jgi:hypothetical protein
VSYARSRTSDFRREGKQIAFWQLDSGEVLSAEMQPASPPPPRWAWMSQQLARSGIDPDQPLATSRRAALFLGITVIIVTVWQAFSGPTGPINAVLALAGFFAQLALIAAGGFCALFAVALGVIWAGRRLSLW